MPTRHRHSYAPDFFNAKVRINGTLWVGNVVVTDKASNWYVRGMDKNKAYDNVVLVVAGVADTEILTSQGQHVAVMQREVPQGVMERYKVLMSDEGRELCHQKASEYCSSLMIRAWQSALQTERMEWQTDEVRRRVKECGGWDAAYFVTVALSWLANMYYQRKTSLQTMLGCKSAKAIHDLLRVSATPYWQMHNQFGQTIKKSEHELTDERQNLIVINAVVPTIFAYGRAKTREDYCDLAFDLMEQCKAERNEITKHWEQLGIRSMTAGDSQSLIQLQREYCNKHQCLRCRFGYEFLKK